MIKIYKTFEIDDSLWNRIVDGFNESFDKEVTINSLKLGFCIANQWGYGFHAVYFDDDTDDIVAFNTYSPTFYKNDIKIMISGSTFVKPKYRKDIFIFHDMVMELRKRAKEEGFSIEVGVPNQNSKEYGRVLLKDKYVADLDYYILPRNLSKALGKSSLRFLDLFTRPVFQVHLWIQDALSFISNSKERKVKYSLITDDDYYHARFRSPSYSRFVSGDYLGFYKMENEDGKQVAYVFDFKCNGVRTRKALTKLVQYIFKKEEPDAILFVGFLNLNQLTLFKVPQRFIPKPLPLTYYVLDKSRKEEFKDLDDKNNWDFSLMNFDVR